MRETILDTNQHSGEMKAFPISVRGEVKMPAEDASADPNCVRSIGVGVILGLIIGTALGVAMLLYVGSPKLNQWPGVSSLVVSSSLGWALFGMIVGSGGSFSNVGRRTARK